MTAINSITNKPQNNLVNRVKRVYCQYLSLIRLLSTLTLTSVLFFPHPSLAATNTTSVISNSVTIYFIFACLIAVIVLLVFNLHHQKNKLKQLEKQLEQLENQLKQSQSQVIATQKQAQQSVDERMSFLARISHEIRTPMNGVLGMAESLSFSTLNHEQQNTLASLTNSAKNLLVLLNDVLDFSKIDAGKLTLEQVPTKLSNIAQSIVENVNHIIKNNQLSINFTIDGNINHQYLTDPTRLRQVLSNLVDNAIKFTEQGEIGITIKKVTTKESQDTIRFSVTDTGIGISEHQQQKLFQPFCQADDDITRKFGGTGLGLAICQDIVRAMGSEISILSSIGEGSCFSFELVLTQATSELKAPERRKNSRALPATNDHRFDGLRVLIVEDNIVNVTVLSAQLARLGINTDVANDGEQALAKHNSSAYDIILSDCHMPNMDGFELARQVKQLASTMPTWLIAITADILTGTQEKCSEAGFDDYLAKPCTQEDITNVINHAYRQLKANKLSA